MASVKPIAYTMSTANERQHLPEIGEIYSKSTLKIFGG
jgi:hypothetical protein